MLREIDVNGDGVIDFQDFAHSVRSLLPSDADTDHMHTKEEVLAGVQADREMREALRPGEDQQAMSMKFRREYTRCAIGTAAGYCLVGKIPHPPPGGGGGWPQISAFWATRHPLPPGVRVRFLGLLGLCRALRSA